jgi:hypothetical protein
MLNLGVGSHDSFHVVYVSALQVFGPGESQETSITGGASVRTNAEEETR